METIRVAANSPTHKVAGAIASIMRQEREMELQVLGAAAVNQAVKAIAIARGYVAPNGLDLCMVPAFRELAIDGESHTAVVLVISRR